MKSNRRDFLKNTSFSLAALGLTAATGAALAAKHKVQDVL